VCSFRDLLARAGSLPADTARTQWILTHDRIEQPVQLLHQRILNPVPTRPAYTSVPVDPIRQLERTEVRRLPFGFVKPTITKSPLRSALILSQSPSVRLYIAKSISWRRFLESHRCDLREK